MHNLNPALSTTQLVDNGAVNLNAGRVLGHGPPPRESQSSNGWYNPNQNGSYLPTQTYQSPNPIVQHALAQEHYAAQLASHYQLVAERNAKVAEEKATRAEQEIDRLHRVIRQQSTLQNPSSLVAPAQTSMLNVNAPLAGQLADQTAASAAPPVLSQTAMTTPAVDLPDYAMHWLPDHYLVATGAVVRESVSGKETAIQCSLGIANFDLYKRQSRFLYVRY